MQTVDPRIKIKIENKGVNSNEVTDALTQCSDIVDILSDSPLAKNIIRSFVEHTLQNNTLPSKEELMFKVLTETPMTDELYLGFSLADLEEIKKGYVQPNTLLDPEFYGNIVHLSDAINTSKLKPVAICGMLTAATFKEYGYYKNTDLSEIIKISIIISDITKFLSGRDIELTKEQIYKFNSIFDNVTHLLKMAMKQDRVHG